MIDHDTLKEVFAIAEQRRAERRRFIKMAGGATAAIGGLALLEGCGGDNKYTPPSNTAPTPTPTSTTAAGDVDVLNFALNLEYLEANYYTFAAFGSGLNSTLTSGTGQQGAVTGGRKVSFADNSVANYAREIAADENAHVLFLRTNLGASAVAQPAINIDGGASGAFTAAARSAGVIGANDTFDPYASDLNWIIGGMLLTDVGVTAYKGSATAIASPTLLEAAAGILAVEAYHSGLLRTLLYRQGIQMPAVFTQTEQVSAARDKIDGSVDSAGPPQTYADDDQGVAPVTINGGQASNIVPSDANGIIFGRTPGDVLNVVYLNQASVTSGGFFPAGLNGNVKTSTAG